MILYNSFLLTVALPALFASLIAFIGALLLIDSFQIFSFGVKSGSYCFGSFVKVFFVRLGLIAFCLGKASTNVIAIGVGLGPLFIIASKTKAGTSGSRHNKKHLQLTLFESPGDEIS
ncbi:hypothetical protein L1987_42899 [Smallanthus sonchifolius]|uniref:Uncharacterized protein n=1 Tax=Smallanthus sonchifolius TaxID=185202 RepID=A0ACB9GK88_9ASTR|nr:hypothetical protein L1987_42899 [Smallanthus sonchifolius]